MLRRSAKTNARAPQAWFVLLFATACGDNAQGMVDTSIAATVEVGSGIEGFEPLVDGDSIFIIEGPQGGRHVFGHARITGMEPGASRADGPETTFSVHTLDGTRLSADLPPFTEPYVEEGGAFTLPSGRFVFIEVPAAEILDTTVVLGVQVKDRNGVSGEDARRVVVKPFVTAF